MRLRFIARLMLTLVAWALAGCARGPALVLDPVGPTAGGRMSFSGRSVGYLEVYTATQTHYDGGIIYHSYTPYSVYSTNGARVKGVTNRVGPDDQRPMTVPLEAGSYRVHAQAEGYGMIEIPIRIVSSRLTEVHLERPGMPQLGDIPEAEWVRLPDGRPVGRSVAPEPTARPPSQ